jgi:hypothetical protein
MATCSPAPLRSSLSSLLVLLCFFALSSAFTLHPVTVRRGVPHTHTTHTSRTTCNALPHTPHTPHTPHIEKGKDPHTHKQHKPHMKLASIAISAALLLSPLLSLPAPSHASYGSGGAAVFSFPQVKSLSVEGNHVYVCVCVYVYMCMCVYVYVYVRHQGGNHPSHPIHPIHAIHLLPYTDFLKLPDAKKKQRQFSVSCMNDKDCKKNVDRLLTDFRINIKDIQSEQQREAHRDRIEEVCITVLISILYTIYYILYSIQ